MQVKSDVKVKSIEASQGLGYCKKYSNFNEIHWELTESNPKEPMELKCRVTLSKSQIGELPVTEMSVNAHINNYLVSRLRINKIDMQFTKQDYIQIEKIVSVLFVTNSYKILF